MAGPDCGTGVAGVSQRDSNSPKTAAGLQRERVTGAGLDCGRSLFLTPVEPAPSLPPTLHLRPATGTVPATGQDAPLTSQYYPTPMYPCAGQTDHASGSLVCRPLLKEGRKWEFGGPPVPPASQPPSDDSSQRRMPLSQLASFGNCAPVLPEAVQYEELDLTQKVDGDVEEHVSPAIVTSNKGSFRAGGAWGCQDASPCCSQPCGAAGASIVQAEVTGASARIPDAPRLGQGNALLPLNTGSLKGALLGPSVWPQHADAAGSRASLGSGGKLDSSCTASHGQEGDIADRAPTANAVDELAVDTQVEAGGGQSDAITVLGTSRKRCRSEGDCDGSSARADQRWSAQPKRACIAQERAPFPSADEDRLPGRLPGQPSVAAAGDSRGLRLDISSEEQEDHKLLAFVTQRSTSLSLPAGTLYAVGRRFGCSRSPQGQRQSMCRRRVLQAQQCVL